MTEECRHGQAGKRKLYSEVRKIVHWCIGEDLSCLQAWDPVPSPYGRPGRSYSAELVSEGA